MLQSNPETDKCMKKIEKDTSKEKARKRTKLSCHRLHSPHLRVRPNIMQSPAQYYKFDTRYLHVVIRIR